MPDSAVLDTNVVLDWLVFGDEQVLPLARRIASDDLVWLATPAMRAELEAVLLRPALQRWRPDPARVLRAYDAHARIWTQPVPSAAARLPCRDPDDQMFVDLAVAAGAHWLLSRDRALLALGRRSRTLGLAVATPAAWAATRG